MMAIDALDNTGVITLPVSHVMFGRLKNFRVIGKWYVRAKPE
jgi:hypothetical protein